MPTRQTSHWDVSRRGGQPTQQCLEVSQETMQPGRKRSGTDVIHDQQFAKRSRENLRSEDVQVSKTQAQLPHIEQQAHSKEEPEEVQPSKTQAQLPHIDQQADSEEEPEEVHNVRSQLQEWRAKKEHEMLGRRQDYIKKSIEGSLPGMSETVKNGLATLPKLESKVLNGGLEGELESLDSITVETDQERLDRVNDWMKAACSITTHST